MIIKRVIIFLSFTSSLIFSTSAQERTSNYQLELDHFVFFVTDSSLEKKFEDKFTEAELLYTEHNTQGTVGKYFLFYNTYIELLYLKDSSVAIQNQKRFKSNYTKRWQSEDASRFGFGFNLIPFDTTLMDFKFQTYSTVDSPTDEYYIMPDYNQLINFPFAYISLPDKRYEKFNSLDEVDQKVEAYKRDDLKKYLSHRSGIKNLTNVILEISSKKTKSNLDLLKTIPNVQVLDKETQRLILVFDNGIQKKEVEFSNEFNLLIRY